MPFYLSTIYSTLYLLTAGSLATPRYPNRSFSRWTTGASNTRVVAKPENNKNQGFGSVTFNLADPGYLDKDLLENTIEEKSEK